MASDIDIAQKATLQRVAALAADKLGIPDEHLEPYGHYKAKISLDYLDTLKELGTASRSNTILLPHSPGALGDLLSQMAGAFARRVDRQARLAWPGRSGVDQLQVSDRRLQAVEHLGVVQRPAGARGAGPGPLLRPAVARPYQTQVRKPEIGHHPRDRADVLGQLGFVEDHAGRNGLEVGGVGHPRPLPPTGGRMQALLTPRPRQSLQQPRRMQRLGKMQIRPGRAGGGEELGGDRGLRLYLQRCALEGDGAVLKALLGE